MTGYFKILLIVFACCLFITKSAYAQVNYQDIQGKSSFEILRLIFRTVQTVRNSASTSGTFDVSTCQKNTIGNDMKNIIIEKQNTEKKYLNGYIIRSDVSGKTFKIKSDEKIVDVSISRDTKFLMFNSNIKTKTGYAALKKDDFVSVIFSKPFDSSDNPAMYVMIYKGRYDIEDALVGVVSETSSNGFSVYVDDKVIDQNGKNINVVFNDSYHIEDSTGHEVDISQVTKCTRLLIIGRISPLTDSGILKAEKIYVF